MDQLRRAAEVANTFYIISGALTIVFDTYVLTILSREKFRFKESVAFCGLCSSLLVLGLGYLCESLRFYVNKHFGKPIHLTFTQCLVQSPHISLYVAGDDVQHISLLLMALDSLFTALSWKAYAKISVKRYSILCTGIVTIILTDYWWIWIKVVDKEDDLVSVSCNVNTVLGTNHKKFHVFYTFIAGYLSIAVCAVAMLVINIKAMRSISAQMKVRVASVRALCVMLTAFFVLQLLPLTSFYLLKLRVVGYATVEYYLWMLTTMNLYSSPLIYAYANPHTRKYFKCHVVCFMARVMPSRMVKPTSTKNRQTIRASNIPQITVD